MNAQSNTPTNIAPSTPTVEGQSAAEQSSFTAEFLDQHRRERDNVLAALANVGDTLGALYTRLRFINAGFNTMGEDHATPPPLPSYFPDSGESPTQQAAAARLGGATF